MKLLVMMELAGVVADVQSVYLKAYEHATAELGLAKTDPTAFWRVVRQGMPIGAAVRGAKPDKIAAFQKLFEETIESDDCLAELTPHEEVRAAISRLRDFADLNLVTGGSNKNARQKWLDEHDLSVMFTRMAVLAPERDRRRVTLQGMLEDGHIGLVVGSSPTVIAAGSSCDVVTVGIAKGAATSQKLTQAGATHIFSDLGDIVADLEKGGSTLMQCGLPPAAVRRDWSASANTRRF